MSRFHNTSLNALLIGALTCASLLAQQAPRLQSQPDVQTTGGTVTGRVLCSDTQHPARFANVLLIPVEEANGDVGNRDVGGRRSGARTDLEGTFTATNVQPGDYYVSATATGYVSESALLVAAGADTASALAKLPTVHVAASSSSTVNFSLERGGVISGRIQWDDGSPAAGVQVNAVSASTTTGQNGSGRLGFFGAPGGDFAQTDDRGQFRMTGIAPGNYLVRASVQAPMPSDTPGRGFASGRTMNIAMYAPGKVRKTDAQTVTVHAGEERGDLVIIMDLTALHRVTGHVGATSGTVASGTVRLVDSQDSSLTRVAQISSEGSYTLIYVPTGSYTLSVPSASSNPAQPGRQRGDQSTPSGTTFQPFQEALSVVDSDLSGVDVNLTPVTQASSQ